MRNLLLSITCVLVWAGQSAAASLPPQVETAIQESREACKPDKATIGKDFVSIKDINADGAPDYILDYGSFKCGDNSTYFCGSAGCTTEVFASVGNGYVKVLNENVQGISFRRINGRPAMVLELHGSACGKVGSQPCGATLFWTGSKFSPAR